MNRVKIYKSIGHDNAQSTDKALQQKSFAQRLFGGVGGGASDEHRSTSHAFIWPKFAGLMWDAVENAVPYSVILVDFFLHTSFRYPRYARWWHKKRRKKNASRESNNMMIIRAKFSPYLHIKQKVEEPGEWHRILINYFAAIRCKNSSCNQHYPSTVSFHPSSESESMFKGEYEKKSHKNEWNSFSGFQNDLKSCRRNDNDTDVLIHLRIIIL